MPGPGGGSRGGGFGGGGSRGGGGFGGGFGGGGFRGGPHHHHHHYRRPGFFFFGPRYYYGGGGCLGGLMGMIFLPVIVLIFAAIFLVSSVASAFTIASQGGVVTYDENVFGDYANARYEEEFGGYSGYEDNILIVVTINEDYNEYYCIAWVGDHVQRSINYMFGGEGTEFAAAVRSAVNTQSYKYSLDSNIADFMDTMATKVESKSLTSSFTCKESQATVDSHLTNKSALPLTAETVNEALEDFTERTGIPVVVVVDEEEDVFGKNVPASVIFTIIISLVIIGICAYAIFKSFKYRNGGPNDNNMFDDKNFTS